ncbi:MAG: WYL domain-containing protein [Frankiaceae bacterium]|nr:WYL domain-containing protein [Frankiaceae bacterium]
MSGATDHLPRLLALVPWLMAHPGIEIADAAREFEVTEAQLRKDLELLWMCGLPGYGPGDLIDIDWHGDRVTLSNADEIARPLRLTPEEALALIAALRVLSDVPGIVDRGAIDRVLAKLEAAAGTASAADRVVAAPTPTADADVVTTVTDGLARNRRLHLRYWVPARDEATERDVDPIRLFNTDGNVYLSGWCYRSEDIRTFRLDRVLEVTVTDVAIDVPDETRRRAFNSGLFTPSEEDRLVTLSLDPAARWVADYYPCETIEERGDGGLTVTLRVQDDAWLRRLALGLAGVARIIDPPELAAETRNVAIAALAAYDD